MGVRGKTTLELLRARTGVGSHGTQRASAAETIVVAGAIGETIRLREQPADIRTLPPRVLGARVPDIQRYGAIRVQTPVLEAGAADARVLVMWSLDRVTWFPCGTDDAAVSLATVSVMAVGATTALRDTCTGDVYLAAMVDGGDGVETPVFGPVIVQLLPEGERVPAPGALIFEETFEDETAINTSWPWAKDGGGAAPSWGGAGDIGDGFEAGHVSAYFSSSSMGKGIWRTGHTYGAEVGLVPNQDVRAVITSGLDGLVAAPTVSLNLDPVPPGINQHSFSFNTGDEGTIGFDLTVDTRFLFAYTAHVRLDTLRVYEGDGGIPLPDAATVERWIADTATLGPVTRLQPPDDATHGDLYWADFSLTPPVLQPERIPSDWEAMETAGTPYVLGIFNGRPAWRLGSSPIVTAGRVHTAAFAEAFI